VRRLSAELALPFLGRRKAACSVAVLTMALALAANTAAVSVLKAFLLSSFALPDPDRLFVIAPVRELQGRGEVTFSDAYPNYRLIRETQRSFADVTCMRQSVASWDDGGEVHPLQAARVTASFFPTTRVRPVLGRPFEASDEGPSPSPVVLISHALWQGALAGDAAIIGRTLIINGAPHTVIGVMPSGFSHPLPTDIWLPFDIPVQQRTAITGARTLTVYGRLKDGVSRAAADAEMAAFTRRSLEASRDNRDFRYKLQTIRQALLPEADRTMVIVQAGALLLTLLAVLNLASLLVAWGFDRQQEMAVRLALGAGRGRIVRLVVLQSIGVVSAGGLVGLMLARIALSALRRLDVSQPLALFMANLRLDSGVLVASAVVVALAGVVAGILPSWLGQRLQLSDALRSASRGASLSPAAIRWQKGMVFAQATLSVVLLSAAALIGISFRNLSNVPDGFNPGTRLVARVQLSDAEYPSPEKRAEFATRLLDALAREPELEAYGFTSTLPVGDVPWGGRFFVEPQDAEGRAEPLLLHFRRTSWNYLDVLGIPLVSGRLFTEADDAAHPTVAIISRSLAQRLWHGEEPIGKRLYRVVANSPQPLPVEIVGVVGDVMDAGYNAPPGETIYVPFPQIPVNQMSIVLQPRTTPDAAVAALRRALRAADPVLAASDVASLASLVRGANALPRLRTILLLTFALVAVGIVALGCYGVMSQLVASRERDFATRLVFGAGPADLGSSVLHQVVRITLPGVVIGCAAAWLSSSALKPFVFGVAPHSLPVTASVGLSVLMLAGAASLPPARRAMRVDIRKGLISA
jgi:putative ABC transport system permease protein